MPKNYLFHKRNVLPRMYQFERHLTKLSPKGNALFSNKPTRNEIVATMQGEGIMQRRKLHPLKFKI
jgi:hypothetical protein